MGAGANNVGTTDMAKTNGNGHASEHDWGHLSGDVRDALLTNLRSLEKPWAKLPEARQREIANALEQTAKHLIRNVVDVVSRRGFDAVPAVMGKFGVDGRSIKGTFEALAAEKALVALADHQGAMVQIVLADAQDFYGERTPAKVDPDQPGLPIDQPGAQ